MSGAYVTIMDTMLMILVICALRFLLRPASARFRCLLWAIVPLRLLCPFVVPSIFSISNHLFKPVIRFISRSRLAATLNAERLHFLAEVPDLRDDLGQYQSITVESSLPMFMQGVAP